MKGFFFLFKINNIDLLGLKFCIFRFEVPKLFSNFFLVIYNFPKIRSCKQGDLLIFGKKKQNVVQYIIYMHHNNKNTKHTTNLTIPMFEVWKSKTY